MGSREKNKQDRTKRSERFPGEERETGRLNERLGGWWRMKGLHRDWEREKWNEAKKKGRKKGAEEKSSSRSLNFSTQYSYNATISARCSLLEFIGYDFCKMLNAILYFHSFPYTSLFPFYYFLLCVQNMIDLFGNKIGCKNDKMFIHYLDIHSLIQVLLKRYFGVQL